MSTRFRLATEQFNRPVNMRFQYGLLLGSLLAGQVIASPAEPFPRRQSSTLTNPILWEDTPDIDPFRVGDVFYYSSSTFAYSPGAPLYKSYDLANWTPVTHSVPTLGFASKYNLNSATDRAYVKGIWASTARYRNSTDTWYWIGCVEGKTYIYTATGTGAGKNGGEVPTGNWGWKQAATIGTCYYDCGLLIDDDDTMYVAYGNRQLHVAQLAWNGLSEVKNQQVYDSGSTYLEGSHMYKAKGYYWIVPTKVASGEYVLRSKSPFGPYEAKLFFDNVNGPVSNAGRAHQGGWLSIKVRKQSLNYIGFRDAIFNPKRISIISALHTSHSH